MEQLGLDFKVIPSKVKETSSQILSAEELVKENAYRKANEVAVGLDKGIVIGADTVVVFNGKILGKPHTKEVAVRTLHLLSGKEHLVYTGLALVRADCNSYTTRCMVTKVTMKKLTFQEILGYAATGEPLDKAGAYAIQGLGEMLIEKIEGCYSNVVGLPLALLADMLNEFGVSIIPVK